MWAFVLRRVSQAVAVMLAVAFVAFALFQYVGDPVTNLLARTRRQRSVRPCAAVRAGPRVSGQFAHFAGQAVQVSLA